MGIRKIFFVLMVCVVSIGKMCAQTWTKDGSYIYNSPTSSYVVVGTSPSSMPDDRRSYNLFVYDNLYVQSSFDESHGLITESLSTGGMSIRSLGSRYHSALSFTAGTYTFKGNEGWTFLTLSPKMSNILTKLTVDDEVTCGKTLQVSDDVTAQSNLSVGGGITCAKTLQVGEDIIAKSVHNENESLIIESLSTGGMSVRSLGKNNHSALSFTAGTYTFKGNEGLTFLKLSPKATKIFTNLDVDGEITCRDKLRVTDLLKANQIETQDIKVEMNDAADYVFDEGYNLRSLGEVESFVKENKHLPGMPSAAEMSQNGVSVSQMCNLLLEKVEELTLHMIELEKENKALKEEMGKMKREK